MLLSTLCAGNPINDITWFPSACLNAKVLHSGGFSCRYLIDFSFYCKLPVTAITCRWSGMQECPVPSHPAHEWTCFWHTDCTVSLLMYMMWAGFYLVWVGCILRFFLVPKWSTESDRPHYKSLVATGVCCATVLALHRGFHLWCRCEQSLKKTC